MKKSTKKTPSPRLLVVGGPDRVNYESLGVDRVACDLCGILSVDKYYDYPVMIYWPTKKAFTPPTELKAWEDFAEQHPNAPSINQLYWSHPRTKRRKQRYNEYHTTNSPHREISGVKEAERKSISSCIEKLGDRIRATPISSALTLAILTDENYPITTPDFWSTPAAHAFDWIIDNFLIDTQNNTQCLFKSTECPPHIHDVLEKIGDQISTWPFNFFGRQEAFSSCDPPHECGEYSWSDLHLKMHNQPPKYHDIKEPVRILPGHVNRRGDIKSLLFISGEGCIAVLPEPQSIEKLIRICHENFTDNSNNGNISTRKIPVKDEIRLSFTTERRRISGTTEPGWIIKVKDADVLLGPKAFLYLLSFTLATLKDVSINPVSPKYKNKKIPIDFFSPSGQKSKHKPAQQVNDPIRESGNLKDGYRLVGSVSSGGPTKYALEPNVTVDKESLSPLSKDAKLKQLFDIFS